jgi:uncharacterized protein (DUF927 family)
MKTETVKIKKTEIFLKNQPQADTGDDAYIQINKTSFQQNFKFLMGHFKGDQTPRLAQKSLQ